MKVRDFWYTLFDAGEMVCISNDVLGTSLQTLNATSTGQFFSINPLKDKRADANVTCYRNILIEFDNIPLTEQEAYKDIIPFTTMVFSGGKSYHFIISLQNPCSNIEEYRALVKRIYKKMPGSDPSVRNPSRFSRTPEVVRLENGQKQTLMEVNSRVSREELEAWLGPEEVKKLKTEEPTSALNGKRLLPTRTRAFIEYGAKPGDRNRSLFTNACELFRAGYSREEIYNIAANVLDLPENEMNQCIASAEKAARVG